MSFVIGHMSRTLPWTNYTCLVHIWLTRQATSCHLQMCMVNRIVVAVQYIYVLLNVLLSKNNPPKRRFLWVMFFGTSLCTPAKRLSSTQTRKSVHWQFYSATNANPAFVAHISHLFIPLIALSSIMRVFSCPSRPSLTSPSSFTWLKPYFEPVKRTN